MMLPLHAVSKLGDSYGESRSVCVSVFNSVQVPASMKMAARSAVRTDKADFATGLLIGKNILTTQIINAIYQLKSYFRT